MPQIVCHAGTGPNDIWNYCPSFGAAVAFTVLFGLTTGGHIVQAFIYRKLFAAILIMGGLWETGGYVARVLSIENQLSSSIFAVQLLLILLAPLWINAYIYMLLGRMIHFFLESDRVFKIEARLITRMFVLFDIVAFLIQATGGAMTGPGVSPQTQKTGLNIYTGGVATQLCFLAVFVALTIGFQLKLKHQAKSTSTVLLDEETPSQAIERRGDTPLASLNMALGSGEHSTKSALPDARLATGLIRLLYAALALIILRNIYRLIESGGGANSATTTHEWFPYVFDAVPMFAALVLINLFYPGKVLQGPRSNFSEQDRERKQAKKDKKAARKGQKAAKKGQKAAKMAQKAAKKEEKRNQKASKDLPVFEQPLNS